MPRSPSPARIAPLRVIHSSVPWCLAHGGVVVAVEAVTFKVVVPDRLAQGLQQQLHHPLAVAAGVVLRPPQVAQVGIELLGALLQPGEVGVLELDARPFYPRPCDAHVPLCEVVAGAARARVHDGPDVVVLVERQLPEVVAAAQRPELLGCLGGAAATHQ